MSDYKFTEAQLAWLEALESGGYAQTQEVLQDDTGYCCLGVGCRVAESHGLKVAVDGLGRLEDTTLEIQQETEDFLGLKNSGGEFLSYTKAPQDLRVEVRDWVIENLDLEEDLEDLSHDLDIYFSLASLNDQLYLTFSQLAKVIRQFPHYLFYTK